MEEQARLLLERVPVEVVDPPGVEGAGAPDEAVDLVALVQEQLREVGAVLAGDPGDQGLRVGSLMRRSRRRARSRGPGRRPRRGWRRQRRARPRPSPAREPGSARSRASAARMRLRLARRDREPGPGSLDLAGGGTAPRERRRRSAGRPRSSSSACDGSDMSLCMARSDRSRTSAAARRLAWTPSGWTGRNSSVGTRSALQPEAARLVAAPGEDEPDRLTPLGGQSGRLDHLLQSLLGAHVAGMQDDLAVVRPAEPASGRRRVQARRGETGPVRYVVDRRSGTPSETRYGVKLSVTTADRPGPGCRPAFGRGRRAADRSAAGDPGLARRRAHQVLEEEPVRDARTAARRAGRGCRPRGWGPRPGSRPGGGSRRLARSPVSPNVPS